MTKKYLSFIFAAAGILGSASAQTVVYDSVAMGAGYQNQMYYDMANGTVGSSAVMNWDIAHAADFRSVCIRANHMTGLRVLHYPKGDKSQWASFDTAGWKTWPMRYNDIHDHEKGAFDLNDNHPYYWGTYNSSTHEVIGDSLFLLVWVNGAGTPVKFLKFQPIKQPTTADLHFRYADVDGSNEVTDTLFQSQASGQNYKFFNFTTKAKPVREPAKTTWDISFNRYYEPVMVGPGQYQMYPVMGVESNKLARVAQVFNIAWTDLQTSDTATLLTSNKSALKNDLTAIGSNWKFFDNSQFKWFFKDSQSYMIKSVRGADSVFWLIHFTNFGGSANGQSVFGKMLLGKTNSISNPEIGVVNMFPNPATDKVYITLENSKIRTATITLYSMTGAALRSTNITDPGAFASAALPLNGLSAGVYVVSVQSGNQKLSQQIVIQ